jgi:hypothetical protein
MQILYCNKQMVHHTFMLSAIVSTATRLQAYVNPDAALGMWSPGRSIWKTMNDVGNTVVFPNEGHTAEPV